MCQTCALRLYSFSRVSLSVRSVYSLQTTTHESESQAERPRIDCVMTCVYGSNHSIIPQGPWPDGHTYTNGSYNFTGPAALAHSPATTARPSSWLRLASLGRCRYTVALSHLTCVVQLTAPYSTHRSYHHLMRRSSVIKSIDLISGPSFGHPFIHPVLTQNRSRRWLPSFGLSSRSFLMCIPL